MVKLSAVVFVALAGFAAAAPPAPYDADPDHLWNRTHAALLVRDGRDNLEPLLWVPTKHLLEGPSHAQAVKVLDELLAGEKLVRDPLKRAVLQRDLWAVFDWAAHPFANYFENETPPAIRKGPLQDRLAKAVRKLAPSKADVAQLPDTYAAAVKSKAFPAAFDPANPHAAFLPPDLFDEAGSWVCVTAPRDALPAITHARLSSGRSAFLVFVRLPEGRKATLAYLEKLNTFPKPWKVPPAPVDETGRRTTPALNPDVPQFPAGTQFALVRQMLVVSDEGKLVATPVTESVQVRTYREVMPREKEAGDWARRAQGFAEAELDRGDLFAGKAGGLHAVKTDGPPPRFGLFQSTWNDPIENPPDHGPRPVGGGHSCADCHPRGGIYGVNSYTRDQASWRDRTVEVGLIPTAVDDARKRAEAWKATLRDWTELKKLAGW